MTEDRDEVPKEIRFKKEEEDLEQRIKVTGLNDQDGDGSKPLIQELKSEDIPVKQSSPQKGSEKGSPEKQERVEEVVFDWDTAERVEAKF